MILLLALLFPVLACASTFNPTDYRNHPMWNVCGTDPAQRRPWYESVQPHFPAANRYLAKLIEVAQQAQQKKERYTFHELVAIAHKELHAALQEDDPLKKGIVPTRELMGAVAWNLPAYGKQQLDRLAWCMIAKDANTANPAFYHQDVVTPVHKTIGLLENCFQHSAPSHARRATQWFCFNVPNPAVQQQAEAQYAEQQTKIVSAVTHHVPQLPVEIAQIIAKYAVTYGLNVRDALTIEGIEPPANNLGCLDLVSLEGLSTSPRNPEDGNFSLANNLLTNLDPDELATLRGVNQLILDRNHLRDIPAGTFVNTALTMLCVRDNYLRTIAPQAFPRSLTRLDLSYNQLRELPGKPFQNLPALFTLILSHNHLTALDDAMSGLDSLGCLMLDHNRLKDLPTGTVALPVLQNLSVAHNRLEHIPADISPSLPLFARLQQLNLVGNAIPEAEKEALRKAWHANARSLKLEPADDDCHTWYTQEEIDNA